MVCRERCQFRRKKAKLSATLRRAVVNSGYKCPEVEAAKATESQPLSPLRTPGPRGSMILPTVRLLGTPQQKHGVVGISFILSLLHISFAEFRKGVVMWVSWVLPKSARNCLVQASRQTAW